MNQPFSDEEIQAFLEQRLDTARREALRLAMQDDPALARRVAQGSVVHLDASNVISAASASASVATRTRSRPASMVPTWSTPAPGHDAVIAAELAPAADSPADGGPDAVPSGAGASTAGAAFDAASGPADAKRPTEVASPEAAPQPVVTPSWQVEKPIEPGRFEPSWGPGLPGSRVRPPAADDQPAIPAARKRQRHHRRPRAMLAAVPVALLVGLGAGWGIASLLDDTVGAPAWHEVVVDAHRLLVPESMPAAGPADPALKAQLTDLSAHLGREVPISLTDLPGLQFRHSQRLGLDGQAIGQLLFTSPDGQPVSLSVMRTDQTESAPGMRMINATKALTWHRDGFGFVLVGNAPADILQKIAAVAAVRF